MSASQILVRQIPFAFDEKLAPVWHPDRPEWSHMVNGASLAMPYLEPFLIKTVSEAMRQVTCPQLKADTQAFIGQEGVHYKSHQRYNQILKRSYPELADVEARMEDEYRAMQKQSLKQRLAYAAGFETMTMGITEWLIRQRAILFAGADASVSSLVLWHMVEETEHKNVAYDLYMHLYGDYPAKIRGLISATLHVALSSRQGYIRMLKRDGLWRKPGSRIRLYAMVLRFLLHTSPAMLRSMLPGYHPSKVTDPPWVAHWAEAYGNLAQGSIPLLDTANPEIPARFA